MSFTVWILNGGISFDQIAAAFESYSVTRFQSSRALLQSLEQGAPDVLVLDVHGIDIHWSDILESKLLSEFAGYVLVTAPYGDLVPGIIVKDSWKLFHLPAQYSSLVAESQEILNYLSGY